MLGRIEAGFETAGLDERRLAMLRFATKVTVAPSTVTAEDVASLRAVAFSDLDVLHITEVAAYYAYVNRIADALGVELEPWIPDDV
ncbi:MAG: peroxidase [Actinobacteria bacterium]|nr:peroxidase [Actinomycetota bacterium]